MPEPTRLPALSSHRGRVNARFNRCSTMTKGGQERYHLNQLVGEATQVLESQMLSDSVIILANMRGGYVNVGSTVHTLCRMSRRQPVRNKEGAKQVEAVTSQPGFELNAFVK